MPTGAGIEFACSDSQGAVLFLRRRAIRQDTYRKQAFEHYIRRHFRSWYQFANDRHEFGLGNGEIMLVTGCDKTAEWASAVFTHKGRRAKISLFGGLPTVISGELTLTGSWETSSDVQHRSGPICDPGNVKYDQTVFIRGYRIRERFLILPKLMKAAAEPQPPEPRDGEEDASQLYRAQGARDSDCILEPIPNTRPVRCTSQL